MKWSPWPSRYASDPNLAAAGEAAEVLHARAWAWAGDHETDGRVPAHMPARLCPTRTRARVAALLTHGVWTQDAEGYVLADWDDAAADLRVLARRRDSDASRARRYRSRDASRDASRESRSADQTRGEEPPNPPASRGACDPSQPIHPTGCRACGTSPRAGAGPTPAEAYATQLAAAQDRDTARAAVPWCGDCDRPDYRWAETPRGNAKCPACHPDLVVGPRLELPAPVPLRRVR